MEQPIEPKQKEMDKAIIDILTDNPNMLTRVQLLHQLERYFFKKSVEEMDCNLDFFVSDILQQRLDKLEVEGKIKQGEKEVKIKMYGSR